MSTDPDVQRLGYAVDELRAQLRALITVLAVVPVLVLVVISLSVGGYDEVDEFGEELEIPATVSLAELPGQAADFDNGVVQGFAVMTILALLAVGVTAVAMLIRRFVAPLAIAAAALGVVWLVLIIFVNASGGGGSVGDLGAEANAGAWWPAVTAVSAATSALIVSRTRSV